MKKTIYLHIGNFKTGTSSIQKFLDEKRNFLSKNNIFIPEGELSYQHSLPISLLIKYSTFRAAWPIVSKDLYYYWNLLSKQIKNTKYDNIIISSEFFCDLVHPQAYSSRHATSEFLKDFFSNYNVKIIFYIREISSYMKSFYKEMIKSGQTKKTFIEVVDDFIQNKSFHAFPKNILDFYANIFGKDAIILKQYSRSNLKNNDIICDFFNIFDIEIQSSENIKENLSLSDEMATIKKIFNTIDFKDINFHKTISSLLIENSNKDQNFDNIASIYKSIEDLNKEYNVDIKNDSANSFSKITKELCEKDIFIVLMLSLLVKQNRIIHIKLDKILKKMM